MKLKLEPAYFPAAGPDALLVIPQEVLDELGWKQTEEVEIDINFYGDVVISKYHQRVGDEVV